MPPPKTIILNEILQTPMSIAVHEDDGLIYIASSGGLHEFRLLKPENGTNWRCPLIKTIKFGMCLDVLLIDYPYKYNDVIYEKLILTGFALSIERLGDQIAEILVYPYQGRIEDRRSVLREPILTIPGDLDWGRIRKFAFSKKMGCIFVSTKFDHPDRGEFQKSEIWKIKLSEPNRATRLLTKSASSMWYITVDDERDFLIVSDRGDDQNHRIDIYSTIDGDHLKCIAKSPESYPHRKWVPHGYIFWPRGVAVDSRGRIYAVDAARIQEFDHKSRPYDSRNRRIFWPRGMAVDSRGGVSGQSRDIDSESREIDCANIHFEASIARVPFSCPKGIALIERSHNRRRIYVVGNHGRSSRSPGFYCALFVCDIEDWCDCDDCYTGPPIRRSYSI